MAGYTRNDTLNNIADGKRINASDLDGEFDKIQGAFDNSTGHTHNGDAGEGAFVPLISSPDGLTQSTTTNLGQIINVSPDGVGGSTNVVVSELGRFRPGVGVTTDLGSVSNAFSTAYIDDIVADTLTLSSAFTGNVVGDLTGNVTAASGTTTLNNLVVNGTVDVTNTKIVNVADPTLAQDAATKNYVDGQISIITGGGAGFLLAANNLSDLDNAATARTNLGLEIGTDVLEYSAAIDSIRVLEPIPENRALITNASGNFATTNVGAFGQLLLAQSVVANARTALELRPGVEVQAFDAGLQSISAVTPVANQMLYTTGTNTYAATDLSAFGRTLIDDASAADARITLGLQIGTDVQAFDALTVKSDQHSTFTAGYDAVEADFGNVPSGNLIIDPSAAGRTNYFKLTLTGSITIRPPTVAENFTARLHLINGTGASGISVGLFDEVNNPDNYVTTEGKEYFLFFEVSPDRSLVTITEIV